MSDGPRWLAVPEAAAILGTSKSALRRALERRAAPSPDGVTESNLDGVRGRKFGRMWRVWLGARWTSPHVASGNVSAGGRVTNNSDGLDAPDPSGFGDKSGERDTYSARGRSS